MKGFHNIWITCFYNKRTNIWDMLWGDEYFEGDGFTSLVETVKRFAVDKSSQYIIFINNLTYYSSYLPGTENGEKRFINGDKDIMEKNFSNIQFRNFKLFMPKYVEEEIEKKQNPACFMRVYLTKLYVKDNPDDCRYTFGHVFQYRVIDPGLRRTLKEDIKHSHRNVWNKDMYNKLICGNKDGLTSHPEESFVIDDCAIYDENSAYSSIITSDNMFPIGQVIEHTGENVLRAFEEAEKRGLWIKFYIPEGVKVPNAFHRFKDSKSDDIGIEYWDLRLLIDCEIMSKKDFIEVIRKIQDKVTFMCAIPGYLHPFFRKAQLDLYIQKKELPEGLERNIVKMGLEVMYGKGLQYREFEDCKKIPGFFSDGLHYFLPHMALHCTAAARYKLATMIHKAGKNIFYWDTDSVHGTGEELEKAIEEANEDQMFLNKLSGNETDIGCWKTEHKHSTEMISATKRRIVYDGKWTTKVSGINKKYVLAHIKKLEEVGIDPYSILQYFMDKGFGDVEIDVFYKGQNKIYVRSKLYSDYKRNKEKGEKYGKVDKCV